MVVHVLVLNFNGRRLMGECLPSVVEAATASRHRCEVAVVDNASDDDSLAWLGRNFPEVEVIRCENRGLCSFNAVVPALPGPVAVLLNNDIKLDRHSIDLLVEPLIEPAQNGQPACFMTAPLCWLFDGRTYEGFKTAVRWRWGLVQATWDYPGHEAGILRPGWTASAGAAMAVDRDRFTALGGFDPLYLPGRIEDLDFAFRGFLAGYCARYVPESIAYHRGMATFEPAFGSGGCDGLALRNTLLFQWKNLRHPAHLVRQLAGLPVRLAFDLLRAPWVAPERRFAFTAALLGALGRLRELRAAARSIRPDSRRERGFFRRFSPRRMAEQGRTTRDSASRLHDSVSGVARRTPGMTVDKADLCERRPVEACR